MQNKAEFYVKNCVMTAFTTMNATKFTKHTQMPMHGDAYEIN